MTRHKEKIFQNKTGIKVNKQVTQKHRRNTQGKQRKPGNIIATLKTQENRIHKESKTAKVPVGHGNHSMFGIFAQSINRLIVAALK